MGALPVGPAYGTQTLAEVFRSAGAHLGVPGLADTLGFSSTLGDARHIVVVLIDGLGWNALNEYAAHAPVLASMIPDSRAISAAFPSTTPVSLATLGTGTTPGEHGIVSAGFWLPETSNVLWPLNWPERLRGDIVQPERTMFERLEAAGISTTTIAPRAYESSGLTTAALRGSRYAGADSVGERVACAAAALKQASARALTYVYWPDLDKSGHGYGVGSQAWLIDLHVVDDLVGRLRELLPSDAALVVTSDHGMVTCPTSSRVRLDEDSTYRRGVRVIAGEPRVRQIYCEDGARDDVAATWKYLLGDRAFVATADEAFDAGWYGSDVEYDDRIGDVIAVARGNTMLADPTIDKKVSELIGQHGGLADDEMLIPLLTAS